MKFFPVLLRNGAVVVLRCDALFENANAQHHYKLRVIDIFDAQGVYSGFKTFDGAAAYCAERWAADKATIPVITVEAPNV